MNIIEDEIIGELRYLTVEFDQAELLAGHIGVISQGAVRRYFEGECPDLKVKKCGGLKLDSQRNIVTMRFGIVNRPNAILVRGKVPPPDNQAIVEDYKRIEGVANGTCVAVSGEFVESQKLLNPGYDELKAKYDEAVNELKAIYDALPDTISGNTPLSKLVAELMKKYNLSVDNFSILMGEKVRLQEKYDALVTTHDCCYGLAAANIKLMNELDELKTKYDALVVAVSKDAQKFSDLLVENEKLKAATDSAFAECPHCVENEKLRAALQSAQTYYENDEYSNMGRIFEQTLKKDSADLGPEGEPELVDGKPDCNGGCNSCESHACDVDEAAKDATDGPISESIPTADELSEAVQEMIKNAEDEGRETLEPDIGSKEIKDIADAMSKPPRIKPLGLHGSD